MTDSEVGHEQPVRPSKTMTHVEELCHVAAMESCSWDYAQKLMHSSADEIERLHKREAQFAAALYAVKEVVAKDSPQWLLADQLARMMLSESAVETGLPHSCQTCGFVHTGLAAASSVKATTDGCRYPMSGGTRCVAYPNCVCGTENWNGDV